MEWYVEKRREVERELKKYADPPSDKLLPDLPPHARHIKTLVLDLDNLLVHSDWTRQRCGRDRGLCLGRGKGACCEGGWGRVGLMRARACVAWWTGRWVGGWGAGRGPSRGGAGGGSAGGAQTELLPIASKIRSVLAVGAMAVLVLARPALQLRLRMQPQQQPHLAVPAAHLPPPFVPARAAAGASSSARARRSSSAT